MTDLITLAEAAEILRTSPNTLRYWRHVGSGPDSAKIGRRIVYRRTDVLAWLDAQFGQGQSA